jgi:hypothetical protein
MTSKPQWAVPVLVRRRLLQQCHRLHCGSAPHHQQGQQQQQQQQRNKAAQQLHQLLLLLLNLLQDVLLLPSPAASLPSLQSRPWLP